VNTIVVELLKGNETKYAKNTNLLNAQKHKWYRRNRSSIQIKTV